MLVSTRRKDESIMTDKDVRAKILNLSGEILRGKATEEEIKRVTSLAKEHNLLSFLKDEFKDLGRILAKKI